MNQKRTDEQEEQMLVKLYMDLTGTSEAGARSVLMYLDNSGSRKEQEASSASASSPAPGANGRLQSAVLAFVLASFGFSAMAAERNPGAGAASNLLTRPLSLPEAVNVALRRNANILRAQKDLEAARGVVIQTRAEAVPKVVATGNYQAVERTDADIARINIPTNFGTGQFNFGNDQNWSSQIKLVQNLYEGGRLLSSFRVARLTREQSLLNYQTAVADAVLAVELGYYDVLLAAEQITVQEASVDLLGRELNDTQRRFEAGTVPRFDVLRAEVELANARPRLIQARNSYRIGKHNLANLLGVNVPKDTPDDLPLTLTGKLEAQPFPLALGPALATALERRTELGALRKAEALRKEDILNARAGYKPVLQAFGGYDGHNSTLSQDLGYEDHGWIAGVQLSWNIFDGFATRGRVMQAMALHDRALVDVDDMGRRIELEVRTDYSNFIEADEVLKSQEKVVEEAEEALRLARARNDAGTGTQLDVLSAQTALTEARTTRVQALHDYVAARARLERAVGLNLGQGQ